MHFSDFPQANRTFTGPEGLTDKNILPVRAFNNGQETVLRMQLTEADIETIRKNGLGLWLSFTSGKSMPPVKLTIDTPFTNSMHFHHSFRYSAFKTVEGIGKQLIDKVWVWNAVDEDVPTVFDVEGRVYEIDVDANPVYESNKAMTVNGFMFALINEEQRAQHDCTIGCIRILKAGEIKVYPTNK